MKSKDHSALCDCDQCLFDIGPLELVKGALCSLLILLVGITIGALLGSWVF